MDIGCITRCISLAVFAASLQAFAQPPDGKGKPAHAGASPFIRFPVPQQSVGVVPHSRAVAAPQAKAPELAGKAFDNVARANGQAAVTGNGFGKSANPALFVGGNAFGKSMSAAPVVIAAPVMTAAPAVTAAPVVAAAPVAFDSRTVVVDLKAPTLPEPVVVATPAASSPAETRAPLPECGAR